jgi:MSHA biogenesis protein MshI
MFFSRKKGGKNQVLGVIIGEKDVSLVLSEASAEGRRIIALEHATVNSSTLQDTIEQFVANYQLQNCQTICILHPSDYHLFQMDSPAVPEKEMRSALGWQIKDRIRYPVDQAAVDYFPCHGGGSNKIFVVASRKEMILHVQGLILGAGLNLVKVTITELSMMRLMLGLTEKKRVAMLSFLAQSGLFLLLDGPNLVEVKKFPGLVQAKGSNVGEQIDKINGELKRILGSTLAQRHMEVEELLLIPSVHFDLKDSVRLGKGLPCAIKSINCDKFFLDAKAPDIAVCANSIAVWGEVLYA